MLTNTNQYIYNIKKNIIYYEILITYLLIYELSLTLMQDLLLLFV